MSHPKRIGRDGKPEEDVSVNPKAEDRKRREAQERSRVEAESKEPWSRTRIEREIARVREASRRSQSITLPNGVTVGPQVNLHEADLSGLDLSGLVLAGANLHGANLSGADLTGASLAGANLHGANLEAAKLKGCDLSRAVLQQSCLCWSDLSESTLLKSNLSDCCHQNVVGLDLKEAKLTAAELQAAKRRQAEGYRINIHEDRGVALHYGPQLVDANVEGMSSTCKRAK